jgi:lipoprotein-anchoring transpeptidase ErfK/SrfK
VLLLAGVILPAGLALGVLIIFESNHLILPGVNVMGADLGSLTPAQAQDLLNTDWNVRRTLALSDGAHTYSALPVEYGLYLNPDATMRAAYAAGRGSYEEELQQIFTRTSRSVQPVVVFNAAIARARLEDLAASFAIDPQQATLAYSGNGQWTVDLGKDGQALDIEAALAQLNTDPLLALMHARVDLSVQTIKPQEVRFAAVATQAENHKSLVNKPLNLRAYDPISDETFTLNIPTATLAPWVSVGDPLADDHQVSLDSAKVQGYINQWSQDTLGSGRVLEKTQGLDALTASWQAGKELFAMVRRLPTSFTVRSGDTAYSISAKVGIPYWRIENANPGVNFNALSAGQQVTIPSKNDLLPVPVVLGKRIVISISQQHMWIYENGNVVHDYVISSGMADSPTLPGVFQVTEHIDNAYGASWDLWMPNWLSIYEAAPDFFNGIHGLPMLHSGVRLWGSALGHPASYGCIILGLKEAADVYNWAENGVVVEIKN